MSDEVREAQAGVAAATVNENQEEQITKPAPKVKPQKEKDPKKVAAGKKLAEKNRQAKAALEREIKREIAEKENENYAGWLPEMSFQTVLSIVGVAFTAFELYQRFSPKSSSGSAQSPISPQTEPKHSDSGAGESQATSKNLRNVEERRPEQRADERSAVSSKSEWSERSRSDSGAGESQAQSADQRSIINLFFLTTKMSEQNKLVKMVTDSAVLVGLTAGVGYLAKKILKENFLGDPSSNVMNYAKFTGVLAGSMALKTYLEDQKILPKSI